MTGQLIFMDILIDDLVVSQSNARNMGDEQGANRKARFAELVESIREKGVLEPLIVRQIGGKFEIIAGERRYRALQQLQREEADIDPFVGCMVAKVDDDEAFEIGLIENLQREDLTPFEAAQAFKTFIDQSKSPDAVHDLAARTGLPAHAIRRQVRYLDLPAEILNVWQDGTITTAHVEAFTRINDADICLKVLGECLRRKLSARELREHINGISPDLDNGFFDKTECQTCPSNTSLQSGLFAESETDGKCINPACFERKQAAFLTDHWPESKAAKSYGTRGYRFGHRLGQESREWITSKETADRCLTCDAFVSVVRLSGMIVSGYERTCVGPRTCFEELYCQQPEPTVSEEKQEVDNKNPEVETAEPKIDSKLEETLNENMAKAREGKKKPEQKKPENTPVYSAQRAEKHREAFFSSRLPALLATTPPNQAASGRLVVLAMALASAAANTELVAALGSNGQEADLVTKVFEIPLEDLPGQIQRLAIAQIMSTSYNDNSSAGIRKLVAARFGLELHKDWTLTEDYLQDLKKTDIVKVCEEGRIHLWDDETVQAYRREKYPGKALIALKREDLIDIILNSGADLTGRVPKEILGEKK